MKALPALCLFLLVAGCSNHPRGSCDPACREGEVCDPDTELCFAKRATGPDANPGEEPPTDLLPVSIQISAPSQAARINTNAASVTGSIDDPGARVTAVHVAIAGEAATGAELTDGHFDATMPVPALDFVGTKVEVSATGPTLSEPVTASVNVTVDNVAPNCALVSPSEDGYLSGPRSDQPANLLGTVSDGDPQLTAEYFVDDQPISAVVSEDGGVAGIYAPADGGSQVSVKLRVTDSSGNQCEVQRNAKVDITPPVVTLDTIFGTTNGYINLAHRQFEITGRVWDDSPVSEVVVTLEPWHLTLTGQVFLAQFRVPVTAPLVDDTPVTIVVTAKDPAGNSGSATETLRVDTIAPSLTITAPSAGATFNAAQTPTNEVHVTFTSADAALRNSYTFKATRNGASWLPSTGFPWCEAPASSSDCAIRTGNDDPATYGFSIEVSDEAGNVTTGTGSYVVDNVAPTFTLSPANGARNVDPKLVIDFSEPVTLTGANQYMCTPNLGVFNGGLDATRKHYTGTSFTYGTNVSVTAQPQGQDDFGNPISGSQTIHFFTRVVSPQNGAQLLAGSFDGFDAAADSDGVVTIGTWKRSPGTNGQDNLAVGFSRLNIAATPVALGSPVNEAINAGTPVALSVNAWAKIDAAGNATRTSSLRRTLSGSQSLAMYQSGSGALVNNGGASLYIPVQSAPGEVAPTSGDDVGSIVSGGAYSRPGNPVRFPSILPQAVAFGSALRWQLFQFTTGSSGTLELWAQSFVCTNSSTCGFDSSATLLASGVKQLDVANLSAAHLPGGRRITSWINTNGTTSIRCEGKRDDDPGFAPFPTTTNVGSVRTRFASSESGNVALATQFTAAGFVKLSQVDFTNCGSFSFTDLGAIPSSGVIDARPVMFGAKPGAIYLTSSGLYALVP